MRHPEAADVARFDRRTLLRSVFGAAGILAADTPLLHEVATDNETISPIVQTIHEFESEIGDRPLSFTEAQTFIPLVTALYSSALFPESPAEESMGEIYIVRKPEKTLFDDIRNGSFTRLPEGEIMHSRLIESFVADYPDVDLQTTVAQYLLFLSYDPRHANGITFTDGVYLFLDTINDRTQGQKLPAYADIAPDASCEESTPAIRFRSTLLHELGHAENTKLKQKGLKHGFVEQRFPQTIFIEEFVVDYTQAAINTRSGLPYTTAYAYTPQDFANFTQMTEASNIPIERLTELRRNARLKTYLTLLNKGAGFASPPRETEELLNTEIGQALSGRNGYLPDWHVLKQYFPDIDASPHEMCYPASAP